MADRLYVRPATKTTRVPDPFLKVDVPKDGVWVGEHTYWHRRIADGSLVRVPDDEVPPEAPEVPPALVEPPEPEPEPAPTSRRSFRRSSAADHAPETDSHPTEASGDAPTT